MAEVFSSGIAARLQMLRDREDGLGQNHKAVKYMNQDFEFLRQNCLQNRVLFTDDTFPADLPSLGFKELGPRSPKTQGVRWKRPTVSTRGEGRWERGSVVLLCCCIVLYCISVLCCAVLSLTPVSLFLSCRRSARTLSSLWTERLAQTSARERWGTAGCSPPSAP
ncbi:UNVERIFIED_CONTAM: hypothetical protein FKN15_011506 [Acipenser sinensis]